MFKYSSQTAEIVPGNRMSDWWIETTAADCDSWYEQYIAG